MTLLAGIDGCKAGWLCVTRNTSTGKLAAGIHPTARHLFYQQPAPDIFTIDIPIGLTDAGPRGCDLQARKLLTPLRGSSVFPAPLRQLLSAKSYEEANAKRRAVDGVGISKQGWAIYPKIREVDEALCANSNLPSRVYEVHPEVCFYAWNGERPMEHPKRTNRGHHERKALVERHFGGGTFERVRSLIPRSSVAADDDILDAFAALWTAERIMLGTAQTLSHPGDLDAFGLPLRMVF